MHSARVLRVGLVHQAPEPFVRRKRRGVRMDCPTDDRPKTLGRKRLLASCFGALTCTAMSTTVAAQQNVTLPTLNITASRLGTTGVGAPGAASIGIVGTSTTVITAEEIERSPAQTLPDILAREPGIQIQSLFGGTNG